MSGETEPVVLIEGVSHRFGGFQALQDVSLTIQRGDIYGLLGLNGAGKTTTIRILLGLLRKQSGRVALFGRPQPSARLEVCDRIGATIEGPAFYPHLSGFANLDLLYRLAPQPEDGTTPADAMRLTGLEEAAKVKVGKYSMGMLQRLYIAQALLARPELIVLDEPTSNLDPRGILDVREMILRLNREQGLTVLLSSHQLSEVQGLCNRVAILNRGRKIVESDVAALFEGHESRIVIQTDRSDEALRTIETLDWCNESNLENGTLRTRVPRDRRGELNRRLVEAGFVVSEFREQRPSLEDFFHQRIAEDDS